MSWNPPVDRSQTRICRECDRVFHPTHHGQHSHEECLDSSFDLFDEINKSLARGFE